MERNPYTAPAAAIESVDDPVPLVAAGRWRRFFNRVVDGVGLMAVGAVLGAGLALVGRQDALHWMQSGFLLRLVFGIGSALIYYTCLEAMFGCTLGKLLTGTRVVDEKGGPITWGQAFTRSLCRYIPFEPFSLLMSDDDAVRGWHDRIPRTFVVQRRGIADGRRAGAIDA